MTNSYYNVSGTPTTGAPGASAPMRGEFALIAAGFALLPTLSGNGSKAVVVNSGGTGLTVTTGTLALAGNLATTGAFNTTLAQTASVTLTLPAASGTLATLAGIETLSNKTLVAPALGTPASGVLTNCTGTASGLTAGTVTTNANLTGPITSSGNVTSVAAQTGTGSTFVMNTSPTLVTPVIGAATGTSLSVSGQLTSTVVTGTAPLVVSSTTAVTNLNASLLLGSTWAAPGTIGSGNPSTGAFTTLSATGHVTFEGVTSAGATGTGNLVFATSPTVTGGTFTTGAFNGTLGATTPAAATVTTLSATGAVALSPASANVVLSPTGTGVVTINPATAGTLNNVVIGGSTALAITGTTLAGTTLALGGATIGNDSLAATSSVNGTSGINITNTNVGSNAYTTLYFGDSAATTDGLIALIGSGNSSYGGAKSMIFGTNAATPVRIITGGISQFEVLHTASATRWITATGSNGGNPTVGVTAGSLAISAAIVAASSATFASAGVTVGSATTVASGLSVASTAIQTLASSGAFGFSSGAAQIACVGADSSTYGKFKISINKSDGSGLTAFGVDVAASAIATNATVGFPTMQTCAGTPTGVPTAGTSSFIYDTTNNKFYVYNGAWKGVTLA